MKNTQTPWNATECFQRENENAESFLNIIGRKNGLFGFSRQKLIKKRLILNSMGELDIWIEKYRPRDFSEVKGQGHIIKRLEAFVKNKSMPHCIFAGSAGTGKTTCALIAAKKLFGESWRQNFLELNASDDRGIDVVRNTIKDFARTKSIGDAPFKIILLDEADALTKEAQQALRRTMESFSGTCRFFLSCNYSSKIIDPIQSRCAVFRFKKLNEDEVIDVLKKITKEEKIKIDEKALKAICELSDGDARKAENILQSVASTGKEISEKIVYEIISAAEPKEIKNVLETALKGDFIKARNLLLDTMLKHGLAGVDIIKQIQKEIWALSVKDENKVKLIERCGEIEFRMVEGSDEFIQLESLLASFVMAGK